VITIVACPECTSPAEITDRFMLPSTAGPVDHVVLDCAAGHHFRMAADRLTADASATTASKQLDTTEQCDDACTAAERARKAGLALLRIYGGPEAAGLLRYYLPG
jgi:hypothetical protein